MNLLRKSVSLILVACITFSATYPYFSTTVFADTLNDLYIEMNELIAERDETANNIEYNEEQIDQTKNDITSTTDEIEKIRKEIKETEQRIIDFNENIAEVKEDTNELLRFLQQSSGKNEYLEYLFDSSSLTDFIQRYTTTEALSEYHDTLIKNMETLIKESNALSAELAIQEEELLSNQLSLNAQVGVLEEVGLAYSEISVDIDEEIASLQELIDFYEDAGCDRYDNLGTCALDLIPPDTDFWRPTIQGYTTSPFGMRYSPLSGTWSMHAGMDIGVSNITSSEEYVYPAANGMVIAVWNQASCGGNAVFIVHTIDGVKYTTNYLHLKTKYVSVGDQVFKDEPIGIMGGNPYYSSSAGYTPWDSCSTGRHLHFGLALGEQATYGAFKGSYGLNPVDYINFPTGTYNAYYDRTHAY